jgi:hypothetical protein
MTSVPISWPDELYCLVSLGQTDRALDLLFDRVDDLLFAERLDECDALLVDLDLERLDPALLVGVLSITFQARRVLLCRAGLVDRVEARLLVLVPDRIDALLKGLR